MSDLVPATDIESIVGAPRDPMRHLGRAVSAEQKVYVLHSQQCLDTGRDLRHCVFSVALDKGITPDRWEHHEDRTVQLGIHSDGRLDPWDYAAVGLTLRWPFGATSAAHTIARVAWPNDTQVDKWSPRLLTNQTIRQDTIQRARERLEAAIAAVEATPLSPDWFPCATHAPTANPECDYCTTTTNDMVRATTNPADLTGSKR